MVVKPFAEKQATMGAPSFPSPMTEILKFSTPSSFVCLLAGGLREGGS
jgi:hypothetical protein